ncbi:TPA: Repressor protein CI [Escherichia coli]|nr:Repressor protein CI [Escherichia coli]
MSTQKITFRHIEDSLKAMVMQNRGGQKVIERILKAYGFKSRQAFCKHLGISQSTMANRYARDTFPADWVVICSMETGASLEWLAFGSNNAEESFPPYVEQHDETVPHEGFNSNAHQSSFKLRIENHIELTNGGKAAIERIVNAYGFKTRQALADHLGISKSTLATRYMRDSFPADWVIKCALETKADLAWLVTGIETPNSSQEENTVILNKFNLVNGVLVESGFLSMDRCLLPKQETSSLMFVSNGEKHVICDKEFHLIRDGKWLVGIDNELSLKELTRLPKNKILVSGGSKDFECSIEDIQIIASIILTIQ